MNASNKAVLPIAASAAQADRRRSAMKMKSLPFSILAAFLCLTAILRYEHGPNSWDRRVRARYAAEAIPAIGDLRVSSEVFRLDHGHLPGLARDRDHTFILREYTPIVVPPFRYHDSRIHESMSLGAFAQSVDGTNLTYQMSDTYWQPCGEDELWQHFLHDLGMNTNNLTGRFLRPHHIQYAALAKTNMASYLFVTGVFGNGDGYPVGTGNAVLEYHRADLRVRNVMTWERFFPIGNQQCAIWFQSMHTDYNPQDENSHVVPIADELFTAQTASEFFSAIKAMNSWGWDTDIRRPDYLKQGILLISMALLVLLLLVVSGIRYGFAVTILGFIITLMILLSFLPLST